MNGKQLKNSILQWAIQGKLVPQNPKDEPASKLLERIAATRNGDGAAPACHPERNTKACDESCLDQSVILSGAKNLAKTTKKKKPAPTSRIYREGDSWFEQVGSAAPKDITEEIPFDIPESWEWCRVHNLFYVGTGLTPLKSEKRYYSKGTIPWVNSSLTSNRFIEKVDSYITEFALNQLSLTLYPVHTLIMAMYGQGKTRGQVAELLIPATVNQACAAMTCFLDNEDLVQYVYYFFLYNYVEIRRLAGGTSQPNLNLQIVKDTFIPLPPLAEQKRIVKKLEQILPLVDEYDQAQTQLDKLNKELPESLKKSILQQAIQGKLVPQNPKDEPASKLLERIIASRNSDNVSPACHPERSTKACDESCLDQSVILSGAKNLAKKTKKKKPAPTSRIYREGSSWYEQIGSAAPIDITEEIPFDIPESWVWTRMGNIGSWGAGATPAKGNPEFYSNGVIPWLVTGELNNSIVTETKVKISQKALEKCSLRLCKPGDVLIAMYGATIGKLAIAGIELTTNQACCACTLHYEFNKYLFYFLMASKADLTKRGEGGAQPNISKEKLVNYLIPLPPLAEQKRIVAKLEQLFKAL